MISLNRQALTDKTQPGYTAVAAVRDTATFEDRQLLVSQLEWPGTISWYLAQVADHLVLFSPERMLPYAQTELDKVVANSPILDATILRHDSPQEASHRRRA